MGNGPSAVRMTRRSPDGGRSITTSLDTSTVIPGSHGFQPSHRRTFTQPESCAGPIGQRRSRPQAGGAVQPGLTPSLSDVVAKLLCRVGIAQKRKFTRLFEDEQPTIEDVVQRIVRCG